MEKERIIKLKLGIPVATNTSVFNDEGLNLDEQFAKRDKKLKDLEKKIDNIKIPEEIKLPDNVLISDNLVIESTIDETGENELISIKNKENALVRVNLRFRSNGIDLSYTDPESVKSYIHIGSSVLIYCSDAPGIVKGIIAMDSSNDYKATLNLETILASSDTVDIPEWDEYDYSPYYSIISIPGLLIKIPVTGVLDRDTLYNYCNAENILKVIIGRYTLVGEGCFAHASIDSVIITDYIYKNSTIGVRAFFDTDIKEIKLSLNLVSIEEEAFSRSRLKYIELPETLEAIAANAFSHSSIENIVIPNKVFLIGKEAFNSCRQLKSIKLSDNLLVIRLNTFEDCNNLESIDIPDSVINIEAGAFEDCWKLSKIVLPLRINEIGVAAFRNCKELQELTILNPEIIFNPWAFKGCPISRINYNGTMAQWDALLEKPESTVGGVVYCLDGNITLYKNEQ